MFNEISIQIWKILEIFLPLDAGKGLQAFVQPAPGAPSVPLRLIAPTNPNPRAAGAEI